VADLGARVYGETFAILPAHVLTAEVSSNAKVLWALFQWHSSPEGRCYPGLKRLADVMDVSEDTVRRAKKELADAELIIIEARFDDGGRRTTDDILLPPTPLNLRGVGSKFATYVGSKDATTNKRQLNQTQRNLTTRETRNSAVPEGEPAVIWFECPNCKAQPEDTRTCAVCAGTGRFKREAL
jgi:hypothetical protein